MKKERRSWILSLPLRIKFLSLIENQQKFLWLYHKILKFNPFNGDSQLQIEKTTNALDTSVCYCIGSGDNFKFLTEINQKYKFFDEIIPLEHPRFIMQYNLKHKDKFLNKYINAFNYKR